jgi:hypothetical protein
MPPLASNWRLFALWCRYLIRHASGQNPTERTVRFAH